MTPHEPGWPEPAQNSATVPEPPLPDPSQNDPTLPEPPPPDPSQNDPTLPEPPPPEPTRHAQPQRGPRAVVLPGSGATGASIIKRGPRAVVLPARAVPLGGVRAMSVRRVLPSKDVPTIGAWCFLDRFGPAEVRMRVEPHPHIGLQTVTWPLVGEIRHRDTLRSDVVLRRGQLNLMTAGRGVAHSEYSAGEEAGPLDALQLWVVLPDGAATGSPGFEQHLSLPGLALPATEGSDADVTVVMGSYAGVDSPATAHTPIVGAEIRLEPGTRVVLPLDPAWEHGILLVDGDARAAGAGGDTRADLGESDARATGADDDASVAVGDAAEAGGGDLVETALRAETALATDDVLFLGDSRDGIEVSTEGGALLFLLGGEPFAPDLVMWWNFAARSHDEIVQAREDSESGSDRFGHVIGHGAERIPAPPIPPVRLMPRRRRI